MWWLLAGCVNPTDSWCERFNFDCGYTSAERAELVDADGDVYPAGVDCDDNDASIHPSAEEACDFIDNNCDGQVDEGHEHFAWHDDDDRDGYGTDTVAEETCTNEPPAGRVKTTGDCDDTQATVRPGAPEHCDGVDNDCDGEIDESPEDGAWVYRDADGDGHGTPDAHAYRCRGDGWADVDTDCDDSNAHTYLGAAERPDGEDNRCDGLIDTQTVTPLLPLGAEKVMSIALLGDVDQDGYIDVGVGLEDERGSVGLIEVRLNADEIDARWSLQALSPTNDRPGAALLGVGDVTGDGFREIFVGDDLNDEGAPSGGAVMLVSGADVNLSDAVALLYSRTQNAYAGSAIGSGDFNGDGTADFLIGAYKHDNQGAAWLVAGPISGTADLDDAAALRVDGESGDSLGRAVAGAGDVDGDGLDDVLLGANGASAAAGAAYLLFGGESLSALSAGVTFTGEAESASAGFALVGAGDTNGDGHADLLIGAHNTDSVGAAYVVLGDVELPGVVPLASADAILRGETQGDRLGYTVSALGDIDGDQLDDIAVGAPGYSATVSDSGAQFMAFGVDLGGTVPVVGYHTAITNGELGDLPMLAVDIDQQGADELLFVASSVLELFGVQNR